MIHEVDFSKLEERVIVMDEHAFADAPTTARVEIAPDREDPYAGLNRAQRRKAMAVEYRAFRKRRR